MRRGRFGGIPQGKLLWSLWYVTMHTAIIKFIAGFLIDISDTMVIIEVWR